MKKLNDIQIAKVNKLITEIVEKRNEMLEGVATFDRVITSMELDARHNNTEVLQKTIADTKEERAELHHTAYELAAMETVGIGFKIGDAEIFGDAEKWLKEHGIDYKDPKPLSYAA